MIINKTSAEHVTELLPRGWNWTPYLRSVAD